ncbi:hypothetical protein JET14_13340 [Martelella lutilitoris]|uniref:Uncharacterized protein n=1 Tax=Martelella lutilitoris TaxID=2583532 RepID=A0A7T7HHI5_9HYPH|nr:hypothetical protein [Martelella lutilitoris]QQM29310.1 hypothetical protein JET14_13340 [Martelella lutilitoris]
MSLWVVIYSASVVGGSIGPLPYGMEECIAKNAPMEAARMQAIETGYSEAEDRWLDAGEIKKLEALSSRCEYHETRPVIGSAAE